MSWSVSAVGKPSAVATKVAKDIAAYKCAEPEETIKLKLADAVLLALSSFPPGYAVRVEAAGSQSTPDAKKPGETAHTLTLKIETLWSFVE